MPLSFSRPRPSFVALTVLVAHAVIVALLLIPQGFELSALVRAGAAWVDEPLVPGSLRVVHDGHGYDGQFSYRLALEPLTNDQTAYGITLDSPAYRQQRILYPLLAWATSAGSAVLVPGTLLWINLVSLTALAYLGAAAAQRGGHSAWWGAALACSPGLLIAVITDLGEPLAALTALAAIMLVGVGAFSVGAAAFSLGVLAHEHVVVVPLALGLSALASNDGVRPPPWRVWLTPLAVFAGWQMLLTAKWGETPIRVAAGFVGEPLRGLAVSALSRLPPSSAIDWLILSELISVLAFTAAVIWSFRTTSAARWLCLAVLCAMMLALMGSSAVWSSDWWFWRAMYLPWMLGLLVLKEARSHLRVVAAVMSVCLWAITAARFVWVSLH